VQLQVEEVDYDSQIKDCEKKIMRLERRQQQQTTINKKVLEDVQEILEDAVAQLTMSESDLRSSLQSLPDDALSRQPATLQDSIQRLNDSRES
jgi:hypothetical protein